MEIIIGLVVVGLAVWYFYGRKPQQADVVIIEEVKAPVVTAVSDVVITEKPKAAKKPTVKKATTRKPKATTTKKAPAKKSATKAKKN